MKPDGYELIDSGDQLKLERFGEVVVIRPSAQAVWERRVPDRWEAARATGLSEIQSFSFIILPQALRKILSPLAGQFISTIKDSAIMSVISIQELTFQGMEIMSATFLTFEVWLTITFLYFILTFSLSRAVAGLERRLNSNGI